MMDGREFLDVATLLVQRSEEGALRSSVSRSYYAAYNYARQTLRKLGFRRIADQRRNHGLVSRYFQNSGVSEIEKAGSELLDLEGDRVTADYKLGDQKFQKKDNVRLRLRIAESIIRQIERCEDSVVADAVAERMKRDEEAISP